MVSRLRAIGAAFVSLLGSGGVASAAEPPTAQDFEIWYGTTDERGARGRAFTLSAATAISVRRTASAVPGCQAVELLVRGAQNENSGGLPSHGIHYDMQPPEASLTGLGVRYGDGRVEVAWDRTNSDDVTGFRILCADENGDPLPDLRVDPPEYQDVARGEFYMTPSSLCGATSSESGVRSMDWDYSCSEHISAQSDSAIVSGLQNDKLYRFAVVAYDAVGNPVLASGDEELIATPGEDCDDSDDCLPTDGAHGCACSGAPRLGDPLVGWAVFLAVRTLRRPRAVGAIDRATVVPRARGWLHASAHSARRCAAATLRSCRSSRGCDAG